MTTTKNIFEIKRREIYWQLKEIGLEEQEAQAEAALILEQISGLKPAQQITSDLKEFSIKWQEEITRIINMRRERRPLAYCLGETEFAGLSYRVIPGVLIPRPDTEALVEAVVEWVEMRRAEALKDTRVEPRDEGEAALNIGEIGIGSGIIAISLLKRLPQAHIWACDISQAALTIATGNAQLHNVHERLTIMHGDWKKTLPNDFDIIVSNPPYVSTNKKLDPELYFEPKEALFAGEDGLEFYIQFAKELPKHFKAHLSQANNATQFAAFEIGDEQAAAITEIFQNQGWQNIEIKNDINNLPRVLIATPPKIGNY